MCVLTIIPLESERFVMTSNRDESALRPKAGNPQVRNFDGISLLMPVDPLGGGTWLGTTESGRSVCLLNGAFVAHEHRPPYRKSRGLVVIDALLSEDPRQYFEAYDLENIEPFTLVILEHVRLPKLLEIRWDGKDRYLKSLPLAGPRIWSAAKLYPPELITAREARFYQWMEKANSDPVGHALNFHQQEKYDHRAVQGSEDNEHQLFTLSITSLVLDDQMARMEYFDLGSAETMVESITLR